MPSIFWDDLIGRTLKRAREASRDGTPEDDFNELCFSFTMTAAEAREERELLPWMERTVRAAGPDYAEAKRKLHGDGEIVGSVRFGPLESVEQLVDHALGLTPTIPMKSIELNVRRFGVDIPFPMPPGEISYAAMHVRPADRCDIRLRGSDGVEIELEGDVIVPPFPNLPEDQAKYRFTTKVMDIVWSPNGQATITGRFSGDRKEAPADLERTLRFASWAGQGPIDVHVSVRDEQILGALATMGELDVRDDLAYFAELTSSLVRASRHLKVNIPQISIEDVAACERLELFHRFITAIDMKSDAPCSTLKLSPTPTQGSPSGSWRSATGYSLASSAFRSSIKSGGGGRWISVLVRRHCSNITPSHRRMSRRLIVSRMTIDGTPLRRECCRSTMPC
jgi:hypothetical protein